VKDTKGMRYIARLLRAQGREIPALALAQAEAAADQTVPREGQRWTAAELADSGLHLQGPGYREDVLDDRARREIERQAAELRERIEDAQQEQDHEALEAARTELDQILDYLAPARGLGGRPRQFPDDAERARKAVGRAITHARDSIASVHPELGRHLKRDLQFGAVCGYRPDPPISWTL